MKTIKNFKDAVKQLDICEEGIDVIKDILFQTFIFENSFPNSQINEIIILDKNEIYEFPQILPEIDEIIGNFHKYLYIFCDSGEGLLIYRKTGGMNE